MPQTGATRYQKFLKSEKAKTKLKAKKDLPKGTNVTKTNFKVKKIVIKEQLTKHGVTEALSTRKLNIKELLSRLNHFNTHSRTDALDGLRELITSHPKTLEDNLGQLVQGITPLLLNIEKVVRRETLKVLHLILSNVAIEKMEPFFDVMSTYLRSAMTHIDSRIQEDSLLFLDILLQCSPERIAQEFHKIIPNFLDMISKLRVDSKPGRTLTVNLDSQITSVKWRVKVLHRLQDFLQKFVQYRMGATEKIKKELYNEFDDTQLNVYPLFNPSFTSTCPLACVSSRNLQETAHFDEIDKFQEYTETLMPLLFETWVEVCPNANTEKNIETVVGEDAAVLLKHILEVIVLLWELVQYYGKKTPTSMMMHNFSQKYRQAFNQHFVQAFPFVTHTKSRQPKSNDSPFENVIADPKLHIENLEICHLFIMLNPKVNVKNQEREISAVLHYVEKTFNENNQDEIFDIVLKIMSTVFLNDVTNWTKTTSVMDPLFQKITGAYFNRDLPNAYQQKIFTLLCKIALENKLPHFIGNEMYQKWFLSIPDILLSSSVSRETIEILLKYAIGNNKTFNGIIIHKLPSIIENLPHLVRVTGSDTATCFKLLSIIYWIKNFDPQSLDLLEKQLLDSQYEDMYGKFLMDALRLRSFGYF